MSKVDILRQAMKDLAKLPGNYSKSVAEHIDTLANDPHPYGAEKLTDKEAYKLRVGIYRVLYPIDDQARLVTIYRIKHRREVYRQR
jgi:mRNA interferase RelE/StbE